MPTQKGYLVLADISGFTAYLAGVELDHAHEILGNLLETIAGSFKSLLTVSKFEGDAVFAYAPVTQVARGETVLELLENTYMAFRDRVTAMHRHTTCTCKACQGIPTLDLKFMAHYGDYIVQIVAGSTEIIGSDVNLVHRLLKNHVAEATGWQAYALFTGAALQQMGVAAEGMHAQTEAYEHLGEVPTHSFDLHARHQAMAEARRVYMTEQEAHAHLALEINAPPGVVWDWLNAPERRSQWQPGTRWKMGTLLEGRTKVGTQNHCAHGKDFHEQAIETIVDWRPFEYYSYEASPAPLDGKFVGTYILEPLDGGQRTRIRSHGQLVASPPWLGKLLCRFLVFPISEIPNFTKLKNLINAQMTEARRANAG